LADRDVFSLNKQLADVSGLIVVRVSNGPELLLYEAPDFLDSFSGIADAVLCDYRNNFISN